MMSCVESDVHPENVNQSGEVSGVVCIRRVIAVSVLEVVGSQQPVQSKRLRNQHQQYELLPVEHQQQNPQRTD